MKTDSRRVLSFSEVLNGIKFTLSLHRVFRRPVSSERAREILGQRLERRVEAFLSMVQRAIYSNPKSPYKELLRLAGCKYGDLEGLVQKEGLEAALHELFKRGVYLTIDEFKGREPAVRGTASLSVGPAGLINPGSAIHMMIQSSGSRGQRLTAPFDLAFIKDLSVNRAVADSARGGMSWARAIWFVPGGTSLWYLMTCGCIGVRPQRWFSQVDPAAAAIDPRYRWSERALWLGAGLAGVRLPSPQYASLDAPFPILQWIRECLAAGLIPHLDTFASSASRLCRIAQERGIGLDGVQFDLAGEPVTEAVKSIIQASGANASVIYGSMESGFSAFSCHHPRVSDDSHFLNDIFCLIQPGPESPTRALPSTALLITALLPSAPFILLNVSMGDVADLSFKRCGCPLEGLGWTTHLGNIRSFEKLTASGMTFFDTEVIPILERELPVRFGGGPADYQLVESPGPDGTARLSLLIHPRVGPLDPDEVADAFLKLIGSGSASKRVMELQWRLSGLLRVERRPPLPTGSGKILHLHRDGRNQKTEGEK
jgi:hypothetical protein